MNTELYAQLDPLPTIFPNSSRGFSKMYFTTDTGSDLYLLELDTLGSPLPIPTSVPLTFGGSPIVFNGEGAAYRARDSKVYAFTGGTGSSSSDLYSVDVNTGIATQIVSGIVPGHVRGAEFYINNNTGEEVFFILYDGSPDKVTALNPMANGPNPAWSPYLGYPINLSGALTNPDGLAWDPVTNNFYVQNDNSVDFYNLNIYTGVTSFLISSAFGVDGEGLTANANARLYTEDESNNRIYDVNFSSGALTEVGVSSGTGDVESAMGNFGERDDGGDAPQSYGFAAHSIPVLSSTIPTYFLGLVHPDSEDPLTSFSLGSGDDTSGDDEDGVFLRGTDLQGQSLTQGLSDTLTIIANGTGYLSGWIDWNIDGDFDDAGEKIATDVVPTGGLITLIVNTPAESNLNTSYARFRYSSDMGLPSNGTQASDGEVEDYQILIEKYDGFIALDDSVSTSTSAPVVIHVFNNDAGDADSSTLSVTGLTQPAYGEVEVNLDGTITYVPEINFTGRDTFQYTACSLSIPIECDTALVEVLVDCIVEPDKLLVSGSIFQDVDEDLVADSTDIGQGNVDVFLFYDINGNGYIDNAGELPAIDSVSTNSEGYYSFVVPPVLGPLTSISSRIDSGSDDAEQDASGGSPNLTSTDLELSTEGSTQQIIGMRFNNISIPKDAVIISAYIEFETDETNNANPSSLTIYGENVDNALTFTSTSNNISDRTKTAQFTPWNNEPNWNVRSEKHLTPDISPVVQEIINRDLWSSGNSLVILIEGTGRRVAESYNGESANAPILIIQYRTATYPANYVLSLDESSLPTDAFLTTDNIERVEFSSNGQSDCGNNFGFSIWLDSDGDSILDKDDVDDDNDGLRDIDEAQCSNKPLPDMATLFANVTTLLPNGISVTTTGFGVGTSTPNYTGVGSLLEVVDTDNTVTDPDNIFQNYAVVHLQFDRPVTVTDSFYFYDLDFTQRTALFGSLNGKLISAQHTAINNTSVANGYLGTLLPGITDADPFEILTAGSGGTANTLDGAAHFNGAIIDQLYFIWNVNDVYNSPAHLRIGHKDVFVCEAEKDFDNDGISNHLDLDADGDGCFDAFEAGHNQAVDGNGNIATTGAEVGANGLDTDVEIDDSFFTDINYTIDEAAPGTQDFLNISYQTGCFCPTATTNPHILYFGKSR